MNNMTQKHLLVYGIADQKKAELDLLTAQVNQAKYEVAQQQVIVNSLVVKSNQFNLFLAQADADQATALSNFNLVKDVMSSVKALVVGAKLAHHQTDAATEGICKVSAKMAELINKLIFSVEIIDKLVQLINKQKSINPLVPDSLITFLSKATADANNAVALTLTALQSCYAAEATLLESKSAMKLGDDQANELKDKMEQGWNSPKECTTATACNCGFTDSNDGIVSLLYRAYQTASTNYKDALQDNNSVTRQLSYAQEQLAAVTTMLNSYQSGLAAATAAAYAA
jgi:hypothetical protein